LLAGRSRCAFFPGFILAVHPDADNLAIGWHFFFSDFRRLA
jgi:hypothetical protein